MLPKRRKEELTGKIYQINLDSGDVGVEQRFTLDESTRTSVIIIQGAADGTTTLRPSALQSGTRRRRQSAFQVADTIEPILSLAGANVRLIRLTFDGNETSPAVSISAGTVSVEDCTFTSSPAALQISGTANVVIKRGSFKRNHAEGGKGAALRMSSGTLTLDGTRFENNFAEEGSAMYVTGENTRVDMTNVAFEKNEASVKGTLVVANGAVQMGSGTRFVGNIAPSAKSIELLDGTLVYSLPVPIAHWIPSVFECKIYRLPCPIDSTPTACDPDQQEELDDQPCDFATLPGLLNKHVSYLTVGAVSDDFPFQCSSGLYGDSDAVDAQSTPQCSGLCPAGKKCARGTSIPQICEEGTFCPLGSSLATPCRASTYGEGEGLSSEAQCPQCPAGHFCPTGTAKSSLPKLICPPGSKCPAGSHKSIECEASTYQDHPGQATCLPCPLGFVCPRGTSHPKP